MFIPTELVVILFYRGIIWLNKIIKIKQFKINYKLHLSNLPVENSYKEPPINQSDT